MHSTHSRQTNRHDNAPDGLTPRELGYAVLASGTIVHVTAKGVAIDFIGQDER